MRITLWYLRALLLLVPLLLLSNCSLFGTADAGVSRTIATVLAWSLPVGLLVALIESLACSFGLAAWLTGRGKG